ncbi:MAG: hypothetical protein WDW38_010907 [Sanguina aurantia]
MAPKRKPEPAVHVPNLLELLLATSKEDLWKQIAAASKAQDKTIKDTAAPVIKNLHLLTAEWDYQVQTAEIAAEKETIEGYSRSVVIVEDNDRGGWGADRWCVSINGVEITYSMLKGQSKTEHELVWEQRKGETGATSTVVLSTNLTFGGTRLFVYAKRPYQLRAMLRATQLDNLRAEKDVKNDGDNPTQNTHRSIKDFAYEIMRAIDVAVKAEGAAA